MTISYIAERKAAGSVALSSNAFTVGGGGCPATGNLLILFLSSTSNLASPTISDSKSNTWHVDAFKAGTGGTLVIASSILGKSLTAADTISLSGWTGNVGVMLEEFSGMLTASWTDVTATATGSGTSPSVGPTSATAQQFELVVSAYALGAGTGFTKDSNYNAFTTNNATSLLLGAQWKTVSATGTQSAGGTLGASETWFGGIVGYKAGGMLVTNQTTNDYWFGPMHLPASGAIMLDDTSSTSLYLTNDAVADTLNNLYVAGKITVSGYTRPFPRPVGEPQLLHGDGAPEGSIYATQGSAYLRRDNAGGSKALYAKTTLTTSDTGWELIGGGLIASATGTYDIVNTTTESSLISAAASSATTGILIPANTLGLDGAVRVTLIGDYLNNSGAAQTCTIKIKFGGTVYYGDLGPSIAAAATRHPIIFQIVLGNLNATNSNALEGYVPAWGGGTPTAGSVAGTYAGIADLRQIASTTQAIDTTANQYLDITGTHGNANASLSLRRHAVYAELL